MPRLPDVIIPKYRRHRPTGQPLSPSMGGISTSGPTGVPPARPNTTDASRNGSPPLGNRRSTPKLITVGEIALAFIKHAKTYYRHPDGSPTGEVDRIIRELRPATRLYHQTPAAEFDSLRLEAVRQSMIADGWARSSINHAVGAIRRYFKFAAARKMIDAAVFRDLETLEAVKAGGSEAKEPRKVKLVPTAHVEAVLPTSYPPSRP